MRSLTVIWYFFLFLLSTLYLALGIMRCPTRWQRSFCATAIPIINISPSARFETVDASSSRSYIGLWGSIRFFLFPLALPSGAWGSLLSLNTIGSPVSCKELSSCGRVPTRGPSSECFLFHSSPSSVIRWGHEGWGVPGLVASYDI